MAQCFINPCGVASPPRYTLAERMPIPQGATLGLLDNGKTNVSLILEQVSSALIERFGFTDVLHLRKLSVAHPCAEAQLQELQRRCTVVVNGVGD
jgi:hypothetical protein